MLTFFTILPMCEGSIVGHDSLYCDKLRKVPNAYRDLDLDRTMPNVESIFIKNLRPTTN